MRKSAFCICKNQGVEQLSSNCAGEQRLCFASWIVQSLNFLNPKCQASSVAVQPGLCKTWLETLKTGFLMTLLMLPCFISAHSPDNSFMGFVVEQHLNDTLAEEIQRTNIAVVYGKNDYMWQVSLYNHGFLSHLLIAGYDIGVQLSIRPFICSSVCQHIKVLFSAAVLAGRMKTCIVIVLDILFKHLSWLSTLDLYFMLHRLCHNFISILEDFT